MKPIKIIMTNIGPFVGEHTIDFTALDNIYLISGKTGSGKTTILDAITYALYGSLGGARQSTDKKYLRSQYCSSKELCSIEFTFTLNNVLYKIERTLPYQKETKKGTSTQADESAILYELKEKDIPMHIQGDLFSNDENMIVLASQKSKTDTLLKDLLSLSLEEFTRIVLLPQGEFATFLKQKSTERKELLSKLFPIEQFTKIIEKLKTKKKSIDASLEETMIHIDRIKENFDPQTFESVYKEYEKECNILQKKQGLLQKELSDLRIQYEKLKDIAKKIADFKEIKNQLQKLQDQQEFFDKKNTLLDIANDAEKIYTIAKSFLQFTSELDIVTDEKIIQEQQSLDALTKKKALDLLQDEHEALVEKIKIIDIQLSDLQRCIKLEEQIEIDKQEEKTLQEKIKELENTLALMEQTLQESVNVIQKEDSALTALAQLENEQQENIYSGFAIHDYILSISEKEQKEALDNAKKIYNDFILEEENQKNCNTALELARYLENEKPCPVCGSLHHPEPATERYPSDDIRSKIEMQEKVVIQAITTFENTQKNRLENKGKMSLSAQTMCHVDLTFNSIEDATEYKRRLDERNIVLQESLTQSKDLISEINKAKNKKDEDEEKMRTLKNNQSELKIKHARIASILAQNEKSLESVVENIGCTGKTVKTSLEMLHKEKEHATIKTNAYAEDKNQNSETIVRITEKISLLSRNIEEVNKKTNETYDELLQAFNSSSFFPEEKTTIDKNNIEQHISQVKKSLLSETEKSEMQSSINEYKQDLVRLTTLHDQGLQDVKGYDEDILTNIDSIQNQIDAHTLEMQNTQNDLTIALKNFNHIESIHKEYETIEKRRRDLFAQGSVYTKIFDAVSGANPKKVPLDSWILGVYLQEITVYANNRLKQMSNGRYEIYLKEDVEGGRALKGLDLEIYDEYTGKSRPTSTLSGGETFMASISLALAISDFVQDQNGGIQLDSMFIDEGFGSLDSEALDKALGILDEIRETRSVGLISHVESLQTSIPSKISVHKIIGGSSIEVCN